MPSMKKAVIGLDPAGVLGFQIERIQQTEVVLLIEGISPLITHKWSEKAIRMITDKQGGKAKQAREIRDPQADYEGATYYNGAGLPSIPTISFKAAAVTAVSNIPGLTKVQTRTFFFMRGELVPIIGERYMRQDMVRVGMGTADVRYRPCWDEWKVELTVDLNERLFTVEQLVALMDSAGFGVGVGEWRPEKDGDNGRFRVADVLHIRRRDALDLDLAGRNGGRR